MNSVLPHLLEPLMPAPLFTLLDQDGESISLLEYRGQRLLLYFYPKAMAPKCTAQATGLSTHLHLFKKHGVEIVGLSGDRPEKNLEFSEKSLLNFTLLSDPNHHVAAQFGVWGPKQLCGKCFEGIHRITFLIDAEGTIEKRFDDISPETHYQEVLDYLDGR